jgi:hypothetical protein
MLEVAAQVYVPIGLGKSQDRNGRVLGNRREVGQIRLLLWQWRCAGVNITLKYRCPIMILSPACRSD